MRPHDLVVLLKIASKGQENWLMKDLANELEISGSEISESLNRSAIAGLISGDKRKLRILSLLDFLRFGLRYVYPQQHGAIVRGIVTAHSAPPLKNKILSEESYVWPYAKGSSRGQSIEPLHPKIPNACLTNSRFYELMALTDAIRIGKAREQKMAFEMIKERIGND